MRRAHLWPVLAALLAAAGCVRETHLVPFPSTPTLRGDLATAQEEAVRLLADGDAWRGSPSNLERYVTPVYVRIDNRSERPLRIQHGLFELVGESRFRYAALSPFDTRREEWGTTDGYGGSGDGAGESRFTPSSLSGSATSTQAGPYVSAYGGRSWAGRYYWYDPWWYRSWGGPGWYGGWYDPFFYGPTYAVPYYIEPLPTRDMVRRALPEGTLEPGGSISGFLYFQEVGDREESVTLRARLVDAQSGEAFGELSIPFQVRR